MNTSIDIDIDIHPDDGGHSLPDDAEVEDTVPGVLVDIDIDDTAPATASSP